MKETNKIDFSVQGAGFKSTPMENEQRTTIKAKSDPWSVVRRVRLPHKPGAPLGSGGGSDGSSA
ncbi:hypothetical protein [Ralstonia sp. 1138]|uniref:hypothetical protein n=1 Tax=Ralstonia sp. 1138 TaxID=3156423 RepID=UPI0033961BF3